MKAFHAETSRTSGNRGFVLLFTALIASIILMMAIGISNISLKEVQLAGASRDAHYAFFAADTGAECALFLDRIARDVFVNPAGSGSCAGASVSPSQATNTYTNPVTQSFVYAFELELADERCAAVTVEKFIAQTVIESFGYNVSCAEKEVPGNALVVERAIRVRY